MRFVVRVFPISPDQACDPQRRQQQGDGSEFCGQQQKLVERVFYVVGQRSESAFGIPFEITRLPEHVPGFETPVSVSGQRFFADHLPGASADEQPSVGRLFFYEIQSSRDGNGRCCQYDFLPGRRASKEVAAPPYGVQKTGRCDGQYSGAGTGQDDRPDDDCTDDADRIPHPASAG